MPSTLKFCKSINELRGCLRFRANGLGSCEPGVIQMKYTIMLPMVLAAAIVTTVNWGSAQRLGDAGEEIKALRKRIEELEDKVRLLENAAKTNSQTNVGTPRQIEELDQKIRIVERNSELDREAAEAKAKEAPKIVAGNEGFLLSSASGDFKLQLKG